jgi:hypothetical protein
MARSTAQLIAMIAVALLLVACTPTEGGSIGTPDPPCDAATFTWYMGTLHDSSGLWTESMSHFCNPGPFEPIPIRWTGPNGYERERTIGQPSAGFGWTTDLLPSGTYVAHATVGGIDFELPIFYDAMRHLAVPQVDVLEATTTRVDLRVWRVDGATNYRASLREVGSNVSYQVWAAGAFAEPSKTFAITGRELAHAIAYEVSVEAHTGPARWEDDTVAQQIDRSRGWSEPFVPEPASM